MIFSYYELIYLKTWREFGEQLSVWDKLYHKCRILINCNIYLVIRYHLQWICVPHHKNKHIKSSTQTKSLKFCIFLLTLRESNILRSKNKFHFYTTCTSYNLTGKQTFFFWRYNYRNLNLIFHIKSSIFRKEIIKLVNYTFFYVMNQELYIQELWKIMWNTVSMLIKY